MNKPADTEQPAQMNRRQAILRVTALLGGTALVGGAGLWAMLDRPRPGATDASAELPAKPPGDFTSGDVALLDEIAETILPATKTPGAKAAQTGAFMALMVTDCYSPAERTTFREGMRKLDAACRRDHQVPFMQATPAQRLAVLTPLDLEQKQDADARDAAARRAQSLAPLPERRAAKADADTDAGVDTPAAETSRSAASEERQAKIEPEPPPVHYFRMMKELALLGFFTSEIGYTQVMRYSEVPSRFDPCIPYRAGEPQWAPHA